MSARRKHGLMDLPSDCRQTTGRKKPVIFQYKTLCLSWQEHKTNGFPTSARSFMKDELHRSVCKSVFE